MTCTLTVHCFHCSLSIVLIQISSHDLPSAHIFCITRDCTLSWYMVNLSFFVTEPVLIFRSLSCVAHDLTTAVFFGLWPGRLRSCKWNQTQFGVDKPQLCLQTLILRDWWLCMVISVMFEVLEYTLEHQLPNFSECWWDHVSIYSLCSFLLVNVVLKFHWRLYAILWQE